MDASKPKQYYPRHLKGNVLDALTDSPVVLIHGPRQCGKTTLARHIGDENGYGYISFDDVVQREAARTDPIGYLASLPERIILDEVQRVPDLFTSLKAVVDSDRQPGRFILTGSANVLLVPKLADSLAGRMGILRLHPLAQVEIEQEKPDGFLSQLFGGEFTIGKKGRRLGPTLAGLVARGGYPAALARTTSERRAAWYLDYTETLIQRDIQDLARIQALDSLPRLLKLAASQTARLINIAELAGPFSISRPTIREYVTLLSRIFLLEELQPWYDNRLKRLIKTAKLHLGDTGLACALMGLDDDQLWADRAVFGQLLETFVYQELRREASWSPKRFDFFHYRDKDRVEVDFVIESGNKIAGVEAKASATVTSADFKGLKRLQQASPQKFVCGVVLYDGDAIVPFGPNLFAVPISSLWYSSQ